MFPLLEKPLMRILLKVPVADSRLFAKVKAGLEQAFGGHLQELIIGGAALNGEVEAFLRKIGFPYTVGYGMTECGPLISYSPPSENRLRSCGRIVDRMEAKVESPDPQRVPGNLWVRGDNVMDGYYKNEKATREAIPDPASGWMNTGDPAHDRPRRLHNHFRAFKDDDSRPVGTKHISGRDRVPSTTCTS